MSEEGDSLKSEIDDLLSQLVDAQRDAREAEEDLKEERAWHGHTQAMCDDLCDALADAYERLSIEDADAVHRRHTDAVDKAKGGSRFRLQADNSAKSEIDRLRRRIAVLEAWRTGARRKGKNEPVR